MNRCRLKGRRRAEHRKSFVPRQHGTKEHRAPTRHHRAQQRLRVEGGSRSRAPTPEAAARDASAQSREFTEGRVGVRRKRPARRRASCCGATRRFQPDRRGGGGAVTLISCRGTARVVGTIDVNGGGGNGAGTNPDDHRHRPRHRLLRQHHRRHQHHKALTIQPTTRWVKAQVKGNSNEQRTDHRLPASR